MNTLKRVFKIVLLLCTSICYVFAVTVSMLSTAGLEAGRAIGLFVRWNSSEVWSERDTVSSRFSPIGWAFAVWAPIYTYQVVWLAYCWTTVCRRLHEDGDYLCCDPDLAPSGLLVWHFLSSACGITWIIITDRVDFQPHLRIPQVIALLGIALCLYFALVSSYWGLAMAKETLCRWGRQRDYWLTVALVQNGLSLFAGWVTVATFINLDATLMALTNMGKSNVSSILCLSIVIGIIALYAIADLTLLDPLTRFVFTPHLVVAWACAGSMVQNFVAWSVLTILTIALLCLVVLALIVKLLGICVRTRTSPLLRDKTYYLKDSF